MNVPVALDMALRRQQSALRCIEAIIHGDDEWVVVVSDGRRFPALLRLSDTAVLICVVLPEDVTGRISLVRADDDVDAPGVSVTSSQEVPLRSGPSRVEWRVRLNSEPVAA